MSYSTDKIYLLIEHIVLDSVNNELFLYGKPKNQVSLKQLTSKTRKREVVFCRFLAMNYMYYVCKDILKISGITLEFVGRRYGKDHATVLHAIKTIKNYQDTDKSIGRICANIMNLVMAKVGDGEVVYNPHPWYKYLFPKYDLF